jgi:arsenite methyltransferase
MANPPQIKGHYGIDAPWVPWLWYGLAVLFLGFGINNLFSTSGVWFVLSIIYFLGGGLVWFLGGSLYLYATRRGKFEVWSGVLDRANLTGNENALDIGCGRGAITVQLALRLPHGHVTGIDLWRSIDQSGNNTTATEANLKLNAVEDRVTLDTADMTKLPFADDTFDLATASLSIHNVPSAEGRASSIREAIRVLKPGGKLLIVDISKVTEYRKELETLGIGSTDTKAGWRMWWSGPWMATRILTAERSR